MREEVSIRCINDVAIMHYKKTHDKWWLKLVIYTERRLNEAQK